MGLFSRRNFLKVAPAVMLAPKVGSSAESAVQAVESAPALVLATSQLGYRPSSPKTVTMAVPAALAHTMPDRVPFYATAGFYLPRIQKQKPAIWDKSPYVDWPFNPTEGKYTGVFDNAVYRGELRRRESRWGAVWQADFSDFNKPGIYALETEMQVGLPFQIGDDPYSRLVRSYLTYLFCARSGFEVPGIRPAENLDDGRLDTGEWVPVGGGWNDAGDLRKWVALSAFNLEGLCYAYQRGPAAFHGQILDEIAWGSAWVNSMINAEGRVWEDVGGGKLRGNQTYEEGWWNENHPGCLADNSDNRFTDNIRGNADDRMVRTTYNPWCQFGVARLLAMISRIQQPSEGARNLYQAERTWDYGVKTGHDRRTLFLSADLRAGLELVASGSKKVSAQHISEVAEALLARQDTGSEGLSHYFLEKDAKDGFRCVAFSCDPPLALLRLCELELPGTEAVSARARQAVELHIERYLLADAQSNPYGVTPYGTYVRMPYSDAQTFRPAGRNRGVRTFIHPYNDQFMIHGTNSVVMHQAHLLARAGKFMNRPEWQRHAEHLLQWSMGHNPTGLSLFTGVGSRHPVPFSIRNVKVPEACVLGFAGNPDDTPYLETSNMMQWNTQEIWCVPFGHCIGALAYL
jgi:hypothetical protein